MKYIYAISSKFPAVEQFGLTSQIRRAGTSISLNLAEGSDRGTDAEFRRFIQMSIGSANEVIAILDIAIDLEFIDKKHYESLFTQTEEIVRQLSGLRKALGNK